jgi:hypothetical protein
MEKSKIFFMKKYKMSDKAKSLQPLMLQQIRGKVADERRKIKGPRQMLLHEQVSDSDRPGCNPALCATLPDAVPAFIDITQACIPAGNPAACAIG